MRRPNHTTAPGSREEMANYGSVAEEAAPAPTKRYFTRTSVLILLVALGLVAVILGNRLALAVFGAPPEEVWDYIVVGGGPAGSTLASKLSEVPSKRVLLLEAGKPSQFELGNRDDTYPLTSFLTPFDIPLVWPAVAGMSEFHWPVEDRSAATPRDALIAKALGGCGIHNAMLYVRALKEDFERWGMDGWDWDTAFRHYLSLERWGGADEAPQWHGRDGPITTSPPAWVDEVAPSFIETLRNMGVTVTPDFNKPGHRQGGGLYHYNIVRGLRDSAARALLGPLMKDGGRTRPNLTIITKATVSVTHLVGCSQPSQTATLCLVNSHQLPSRRRQKGPLKMMMFNTNANAGVEYVKDGVVHEARIVESADGGVEQPPDSHDVILTAGAINTAKLLQVSGIGEPKELKKAGLPSLVNVPGVGRNLDDHPGLGLMFGLGVELLQRFPSAYTVAQELETYKLKVSCLLMHLSTHSLTHSPPTSWRFPQEPDESSTSEPTFGVFASTGQTAGAFFKSDIAEAAGELSSKVPDVQLTVWPRVTEPHLFLSDKGQDDDTKTPALLITIALLDPEGRKRVNLHANDPFDGPPWLGEDPEVPPLTDQDREKLLWALNKVHEIMSHEPLAHLTSGPMTPGLTPDMSDADKRMWILSNHYPNSHWCGTAKMGTHEDPMAVVDATLRVRGVRNLRVADASVLPDVPNGNVHSTVVMFASHAAELILAEAPPVS
ncbi:unnamed protein product [Chrysoparadoxa australica]